MLFVSVELASSHVMNGSVLFFLSLLLTCSPMLSVSLELTLGLM